MVPADEERSAGVRSDDLTRRQAEILTLIAAGMSNAEIAAALVVSVRTVERHVADIYAKLGIQGRAGRAPAAAYAVQHGLVPAPPPS
jgi:DNA-binding NarL/FixJ family response regulator